MIETLKKRLQNEIVEHLKDDHLSYRKLEDPLEVAFFAGKVEAWRQCIWLLEWAVGTIDMDVGLHLPAHKKR